MVAPFCDCLNFLSGHRKPKPSDVSFAPIAPGVLRTPSTTDTNTFHVFRGHAHEGLLRAMAKNLRLTLVGRLEDCKGCLMRRVRRHLGKEESFRKGGKTCMLLTCVMTTLVSRVFTLCGLRVRLWYT